jgi:hypothetical protein
MRGDVRQKIDCLPPGDPSKHQRAQHRNGVWRGTVEMPGSFSRRIKARYRIAPRQHFRPFTGRQPAERIGDGAGQGIS